MAILTLAEAKLALNMSSNNTFDAELPDYIDAAQEAVDYLCGPSESIALSETVLCAAGAIALKRGPVLSLTSVTGQSRGSVDVSSLWVSDGDVVRAKTNASPILPDYYTVVYNAGRPSVPKAIKQGCKIILKHQWETQRGSGSTRGGLREDVTVVPGLGYAIPNRALQQMDRYLRGPAVG